MSSSKEMEYFEKYRTNLIMLTRRADSDVTELAQDEDFKFYVGKTLDDIKYSLSIMEQNIFPIALFAKFQAGKSTTTAAMADGREITPCGKGGGGLRTSTIPVTIYNDDEVKEIFYKTEKTTPVRINLYSKEELVQFLLSVAGGNLSDQKVQSYDLDNLEDFVKLKGAVEQEIAIYANDENYSGDKLSTLREAILILAFYNSESYKKLCAGEFSTIASMQPFLKVEKWNQKWKDLRKEGFNLIYRKNLDDGLNFKEKESLHVFIKDIMVPVHSNFMKEIGAAIIDAPGAMSNLRDDERALKAAMESAVIIFVLNGDREFTQAEIELLRTLRKAGLAEKVVFVLNYRRPPQTIKNLGIEDAILDVLEGEGYTQPHHKRILYCNAYLAMSSFQATMIQQDSIDDLSRKGILDDAQNYGIKYGTLAEALEKITKRVLRAVDEDDLADKLTAEGLSKDVIKEIREVSGWDEMTKAIHNHVIENRAAGVLRDLGVRPVVKALEDTERILKAREDAAEMDEVEAETAYEEAKKLLDEFSKEAEDLLEDVFTDDIDKTLAQDYYDKVILGSVEEAAKASAPKVFDKTGFLKNVGDKLSGLANRIANVFRDNEQKHFGIEQQCNNIISNSYEKSVAEHATKWSNNLENSESYRRQIKRNVLNTQRELKRLWKDLGLNENELLVEIDSLPSDLTGLMSKDIARRDVKAMSLDTALQAKFDTLNVVAGLLSGLGTYIGGAYIYINVLPATFIIPFFGQILLAASAIVALFVYLLGSDKRGEKIKNLEGKIAGELRASITKDHESIKEKLIEGSSSKHGEDPNPGIKFIREFYVTFFQAILESQKIALEKAYDEKKKELAKTKAQREAISIKAQTWRTERITPLREDLDEVKAQIEDVWGTGEITDAQLG